MFFPRLLAKSIQVTFTATSGAGGFALSPYLAVVNVVDRSMSLGFSLFDDAWVFFDRSFGFFDFYERPHARCEAWYEGDRIVTSDENIRNIGEILQTLYDNLAQQLDTGRVSALDQDKDAYTLLHVSAFLNLRKENDPLHASRKSAVSCMHF